MTALTVAIAASGDVLPLVATLRSLKTQTEVACEIIVVDDGLSDTTALRECMNSDARVRLYCNEGAVGEVASLQQAFEHASSDLITFLSPGDVLLPAAVRTLHDAVAQSARVGAAHAYWFPVDDRGRIPRQRLRRHRQLLLDHIPPGLDHRRELIVQGNIVQALPTFRRDVLLASGGLKGRSLDEALYGAMLHALTRSEVRLVPELLCRRQLPSSHGWRLRDRPTHVGALVQCTRMVRAGEARTLWGAGRFMQLAAAGLFSGVLAINPRDWRSRVWRLKRRLGEDLRLDPRWHALRRMPTPIDALMVLLPLWKLTAGLRVSPRRALPVGAERIAYVLWRYPTLSETFIRREVQALRDTGVPLDVFALEVDDPPLAPDPASPSGTAIYFGPASRDVGRTAVLQQLRRRPWTVLRLWLFIVGHRYDGRIKTWWRDRDLLFLAAQLASALAKHRITHVHSPWANHYAIVAFVASRMLGATFSVQARASEIHRTTEPKAIPDRLRFAEFVITNSRYNERYLCQTLGRVGSPPIHVIYNGVELPRFKAAGDAERAPGPCRLLAVGRLIEPKGFRYLLQACALLRDRGLSFTCEIIGGAADPLDTVTWLELRMLLRELELESMVCFRGAQDFSHVLEAYRRADVFVLPCVRARDGSHDITPNSVIEAMAMGLPVVSTSSGAIPEIVEHGRDGLLMPPADAHALADALARLIGDPALRRQLGAAAREKVEQRFDIERNVKQRVALFQSLRTR